MEILFFLFLTLYSHPNPLSTSPHSNKHKNLTKILHIDQAIRILNHFSFLPPHSPLFLLSPPSCLFTSSSSSLCPSPNSLPPPPLLYHQTLCYVISKMYTVSAKLCLFTLLGPCQPFSPSRILFFLTTMLLWLILSRCQKGSPDL